MIFDVPRITTTLRNSLTPENSAVIYNTDNNRYEYYNGSTWKAFGEGQVISFNTRTESVILQDSDIASLGDFTVSGTVTINNDIILGNEALKIITSSTDPNVSEVAANIGSIILKNDGTLWQKLDNGNGDWSSLNTGSFTNEPTGFPVGVNGQIDHTSSSISFNDGSYTFSISPTSGSYTVLIKGRQYRKTTTESISINPATEGLHYFYFNTSGVLETSTSLTASTFLNNALIAFVYWDSTNNKVILFGNERHGCTMDSHTQVRLHFERGAVYVSGMALNNFTVDDNATSESHLTFSASSGELRDEDILHSLSSKGTNAGIPIFYREGTVWRSITPSASGGTYARALGSIGTPGQIAYNQLNAGVWSRVSVPNNKFCCYHIIGTNDVNNPFVIVMGTNEYLNKQDAQTGALNEIGTLSDLPFIEMVFVGTVLFQCNTSGSNSLLAAIVTAGSANYVDWRFRTTLNPSTANISNHNNLGGIYGLSPYYHSDQPISTSDVVSFAGITSTGTLSVSGTSTLNTTSISTANVTGDLNVTGTSTQSIVNMTTSNVSGALNVTGTSTQSTVNITTGNITTANVTGALNVTGTSTQSTVNMTNSNISSDLNVTGTSNLNTTNLTIGNVSSNLNVTGTSNLNTTNLTIGNVSSNLNVTGTSTLNNVNINGDLVSSGTSTFTSVNLTGNLTIGGNLTVNGTTTTVNSTVTTLQDPIITLGLSPASVDDNKDRGIAFNYNSSGAKIGFFGYDDSTGKFTFIPDATITGEVVAGSKGVLDANIDWNDVTNTSDVLTSAGGTVTGTLTFTTGTLTANSNSTINLNGANTFAGFTSSGTATFNSDIVANIGTSTFKFGNIGTLTVTSAMNVNNASTANFTGPINVSGTSTMTTINLSNAINVTGTGTFTDINLGTYPVRTGMSSIQSNGTTNLSSSKNLIYYFNYVAASGTVTSGSINFTNGQVGEIIYARVNSDGSYTFGTNMRFPSDIAPTPSANGRVDIYSFLCISSTQYLGTFAFNYTG